MTEAVETSIKKTIAYFGIFDFPLTEMEVYKNLWQPGRPVSFAETEAELERLVANNELEVREGFYFLKHASDAVINRKKKYLVGQAKMKKARRVARLISCLPFVSAIFVCNDMSYLNANADSDIDFAVLTAKGRIWTARFFAAGLMAILGQRPTAKNRADKACLSFYSAEDGWNLEKLTYLEDIHLIYWLSQFFPVYGEQTAVDDFFAQNSWLKEFLPNWFPVKPNRRWTVQHRCLIKKIVEAVLNGTLGLVVEKLLKTIQLRILPKHLAELAAAKDTDVVINDQILKFHDRDARLAIKKQWEEKCAAINTPARGLTPIS